MGERHAERWTAVYVILINFTLPRCKISRIKMCPPVHGSRHKSSSFIAVTKRANGMQRRNVHACDDHGTIGKLKLVLSLWEDRSQKTCRPPTTYVRGRALRGLVCENRSKQMPNIPRNVCTVIFFFKFIVFLLTPTSKAVNYYLFLLNRIRFSYLFSSLGVTVGAAVPK